MAIFNSYVKLPEGMNYIELSSHIYIYNYIRIDCQLYYDILMYLTLRYLDVPDSQVDILNLARFYWTG